VGGARPVHVNRWGFTGVRIRVSYLWSVRPLDYSSLSNCQIVFVIKGGEGLKDHCSQR
jgi:hypothetical protein